MSMGERSPGDSRVSSIETRFLILLEKEEAAATKMSAPSQPPAAMASSSSHEGAVTAPASKALFSSSTNVAVTGATSFMATSHGQPLALNAPSTLTQLPNRCNDPECVAPVNVVPESCPRCGLGTVHLFCQMFRLDRFCSPSELMCYNCPSPPSSTNLATLSGTSSSTTCS